MAIGRPVFVYSVVEWLVNNELGRAWREAVVAQFKLLTWYRPRGTEWPHRWMMQFHDTTLNEVWLQCDRTARRVGRRDSRGEARGWAKFAWGTWRPMVGPTARAQLPRISPEQPTLISAHIQLLGVHWGTSEYFALWGSWLNRENVPLYCMHWGNKKCIQNFLKNFKGFLNVNKRTKLKLT
jgi:hypothetical protein